MRATSWRAQWCDLMQVEEGVDLLFDRTHNGSALDLRSVDLGTPQVDGQRSGFSPGLGSTRI